ncbi:type II toxin-antitoxin system VapC family toxin [Streptomyces rubiginosohelvolus]|uniref:type II toxin-antitoxin system VapC family toxin n=1 Tax=Streptomyces rubiginosohelvolus TaxID=67362 RepID=UPI001002127F|nr:hypothetical protein SSPNP10_12295 [Streptomyces sp. NP10]
MSGIAEVIAVRGAAQHGVSAQGPASDPGRPAAGPPYARRRLAFPSLPVTAAHGVRAGRLPLVHEDPFDRLLIAQAQAHRLALVTRNALIPQYDVTVVRV